MRTRSVNDPVRILRMTWPRWTFTVFSAVPLFSADLRPDYQPAAYAIKGARVVPVAGEPIELGTVVVGV